jgi:hypothetical protein
VREEEISKQFSQLLGQFRFDDAILEWVKNALRESHAVERQEQAEAVERLVDTRQRLQSRIDAMYLDKLDGRITADFFDAKSAEWRSQQDRWRFSVCRTLTAPTSRRHSHSRTRENARNLFDRQGQPKAQTSGSLFRTRPGEDGKLASTYRQPFDLIAKPPSDPSAGVEQGPEIAKSEIWLD